MPTQLKMLVKILKRIKFLKKLANKIYPNHVRKIISNFRILAKQYNQLDSIKKFSCIDKNGHPIPWYTYPAIEYLENLDFHNKQVFEYGSGNSSCWWSLRCKKIISIESDEIWFKKILDSTLTFHNFEYRLATEKNNYIRQNDIHSSDVIIIDGLYRSECADFVIDKIKFEGINPSILIFDNSDWYPKTISKLNQFLENWVQVDFSGFGPINDYTWTTTLFINPLKNKKVMYKSELKSIAGIQQVCD